MRKSRPQLRGVNAFPSSSIRYSETELRFFGRVFSESQTYIPRIISAASYDLHCDMVGDGARSELFDKFPPADIL